MPQSLKRCTAAHRILPVKISLILRYHSCRRDECSIIWGKEAATKIHNAVAKVLKEGKNVTKDLNPIQRRARSK